MTKKIVIFINGLPFNGNFKETIKKVYNVINKYNDNIIPCFNSFNLIRSKVSAFKDKETMENEFKSIVKNVNDYSNYNFFDIELYHEYISEINKLNNDKVELKHYHPQWLLNHLAIKKFLQSSTIEHKDFIYIRIRPDRLQYLQSLINFAINNYSKILKTNTYYQNGGSCGFNQFISERPNIKEKMNNDEADELNFILKENNYVICDQQHICNYYVMLKFMNFKENIDKIHSSETYKRMMYFCQKGNYDLRVNNETKLAYYLINEKISIQNIR